MANTCTYRPEGMSGTLTHNHRDSISEVYLAIYDDVQSDIYTAMDLAQNASPNPLPLRRGMYPGAPLGNIFCQSLTPAFTSETRKAILWTASYGPPEKGEDDSHQGNNPLLRPPVLNVEYIESEYVIDQAENVEALSHGDGKGGARAAGTSGPIVNAAGKRADEPAVDTQRNAVLVVQRNFAALSDIVSLNETYQRTTNSDTVEGFSVRRLKYLVTESSGSEVENNVTFWPGTTRIEVKKTTDFIIDNVGYEYWNATASNWSRAKDKDGAFTAEPINLKRDGDQGGDNTTTITYRHLDAVAYATLIQ